MVFLDLFLACLLVTGGAAFFAFLSRAKSTQSGDQDEAGSATATRWQTAMEATRQALARAQEESDLQARLSALDVAIDAVRLTHSRATTNLQREAATALEETVRASWRQAQSEWHLAQARAVLRRALGGTDTLAQGAALEEFNRERDKAKQSGASPVQLRVLETEAESVFASIGLPIPRDVAVTDSTTSTTSSSSSTAISNTTHETRDR